MDTKQISAASEDASGSSLEARGWEDSMEDANPPDSVVREGAPQQQLLQPNPIPSTGSLAMQRQIAALQAQLAQQKATVALQAKQLRLAQRTQHGVPEPKLPDNTDNTNNEPLLLQLPSWGDVDDAIDDNMKTLQHVTKEAASSSAPPSPQQLRANRHLLIPMQTITGHPVHLTPPPTPISEEQRQEQRAEVEKEATMARIEGGLRSDDPTALVQAASKGDSWGDSDRSMDATLRGVEAIAERANPGPPSPSQRRANRQLRIPMDVITGHPVHPTAPPTPPSKEQRQKQLKAAMLARIEGGLHDDGTVAATTLVQASHSAPDEHYGAQADQAEIDSLNRRAVEALKARRAGPPLGGSKAPPLQDDPQDPSQRRANRHLPVPMDVITGHVVHATPPPTVLSPEQQALQARQQQEAQDQAEAKAQQAGMMARVMGQISNNGE